MNRVFDKMKNTIKRIIVVLYRLAASGTNEKLGIRFSRKNDGKKQLLIDVTIICKNDFKTGIQRVCRGLLRQFMLFPNDNFNVYPVFMTEDKGYLHYEYETQYAEKMNIKALYPKRNGPVCFNPGDILYIADATGGYFIGAGENGIYEDLRSHGVRTFVNIYDLLPLQLPQYFPEKSVEGYERWIKQVPRLDGALCISKNVKCIFEKWLDGQKNKLDYNPKFKIGWFYLSADIEDSIPTMGLPKDYKNIVSNLANSMSFLMVGTIEPRKGYRQILDAFEMLWKDQINATLIIVGKKGWMMDDFCDRILKHPELNKRLLWLDGISDEYLDKIYNTAKCLIAASEGEGFGLPLIEAAKHKMAIIARDIPIFREVAGDNAVYFSGNNGCDIYKCILNWLDRYRHGHIPLSSGMHMHNWAESRSQIADFLLN